MTPIAVASGEVTDFVEILLLGIFFPGCLFLYLLGIMVYKSGCNILKVVDGINTEGITLQVSTFKKRLALIHKCFHSEGTALP